MQVILIDGDARASLAAARSLSKAGHDLSILSPKTPSLAGKSRFAKINSSSKEALCPNYDDSTFSFWLLDYLSNLNTTPKTHALIPVTENFLGECLKIEDELRKLVKLPFPGFEEFKLSTNKQALSIKAKELGLNVPSSFELKDLTDKEIKDFTYPAVLKPISTKESAGLEKVIYPKCADEVLSIKKENHPYLLQEKIEGEGAGVFLLFENNKEKAVFCHKRLLEKPPSGGVSVLSESISKEVAPVEDSIKLLKSLNWSGLAMLEFKKHHDGKYYLIEINPRFWGSLALSTQAGIDFPSLLLKENQELSDSYKEGLRLRWVIGSLDHFLILLKEQKLTAFYNLLFKNSLLFSLKKETFFDVFSFQDINPFFFELKNWFKDLLCNNKK